MLSHPQSQWYSVPRRNSPPRKSTPSWETKSWVSSLLHKPFFFFLPILHGSTSVSSPWRDPQSWGSQRWPVTRKKRRSYQYQPHNRSNGISGKMLCRQPQQFLTLKESKASTAATDHLKISSAFFSLLSLACTTVLTLPAAHLTTVPYLPSPASTVTCSANMAVNTAARGGWGLVFIVLRVGPSPWDLP